MSNYRQLTQEQRYQIYVLMKVGICQTEIARVIGVHKSTINRERRRNRGLRGYRPKQAQRFAKMRRAKAVTTRISPDTWILVERLLRDDWSPEQISGWLFRERQITVSHEWIYQFVLTKNKKPHAIYMADPLYEIMRDRHTKRNIGYQYVFHKDGKQIKDIRFSWNVACRAANLGYGYSLNKTYEAKWERRYQPGPTIHDFRRTAARNLIRAGIAQSIAKKITGHKTDTVFERYNIIDTRDLRRAAELQAEANGYKNGYNHPNSTKKESNLSG